MKIILSIAAFLIMVLPALASADSFLSIQPDASTSLFGGTGQSANFNGDDDLGSGFTGTYNQIVIHADSNPFASETYDIEFTIGGSHYYAFDFDGAHSGSSGDMTWVCIAHVSGSFVATSINLAGLDFVINHSNMGPVVVYGSPGGYNVGQVGVYFNEAANCADAPSSDPFVTTPPNTNTRIISTVPAGGATVATSTSATVGADVYVNPLDYKNGDYVEIKYAPYSSYQAAVADPNLLFTKIDFQIATSGESDFSTTSPITTQGLYTMSTTLYGPNTYDFFNIFSFNLGSSALLSTSTQFTAGSLSGYDIFVASTTASINAYLASSTVSLASCTSFTSFSLGDCMNLIFVPQAAPIEQALGAFKEGFLSYAPWGYITRFITILSGEGAATSSLPVLSATFPLGPSQTMTTFTIDPNTFIPAGDALLNSATATFGPGEGESFQQILEPILDELLALLVTIAIIHDILSIRGKSKYGKGPKEKLR